MQLKKYSEGSLSVYMFILEKKNTSFKIGDLCFHLKILDK